MQTSSLVPVAAVDDQQPEGKAWQQSEELTRADCSGCAGTSVVIDSPDFEVPAGSLRASTSATPTPTRSSCAATPRNAERSSGAAAGRQRKRRMSRSLRDVYGGYARAGSGFGLLRSTLLAWLKVWKLARPW